jgi:hypothetical protein
MTARDAGLERIHVDDAADVKAPVSGRDRKNALEGKLDGAARNKAVRTLLIVSWLNLYRCRAVIRSSPNPPPPPIHSSLQRNGGSFDARASGITGAIYAACDHGGPYGLGDGRRARMGGARRIAYGGSSAENRLGLRLRGGPSSSRPRINFGRRSASSGTLSLKPGFQEASSRVCAKGAFPHVRLQPGKCHEPARCDRR